MANERYSLLRNALADLADRQRRKKEDKPLEEPTLDPIMALAMLMGDPGAAASGPGKALANFALNSINIPSLLGPEQPDRGPAQLPPKTTRFNSSSKWNTSKFDLPFKNVATKNNTISIGQLPTSRFEQTLTLDPEDAQIYAGPAEYYYPHGVGEGKTAPIERFGNPTFGLGGVQFGDASKTTKLATKDPRILNAQTKPATDFVYHPKNAPTRAVIDPRMQKYIEPLKAGEKPPPKLLYHGPGMGGWGAMDKIQKEGLKGGWFAEEPASVGELLGTYLGVDPKKLPKLLTQRRIYPQDPPVEIIPDWAKASGRAVGVPSGKADAQDFLEKMGADRSLTHMASHTVSPEDIYIVDALKNILGKLKLLK